MKRLPVFLLFLSLVIASCSDSGDSSGKEASGSQQSTESASAERPSAILASVGVGEFHKRIKEDPNALLLDVRTQSERDTDAVIRLDGIPADHWDFMEDNFQDRISKADPDIHIYIYCASGIRSTRAGRMLIENGVAEVYNLLGGIYAWKAEGKPTQIP